MSQGWIGVDLDGTLAKYSGWQGPSHIGEPIPRMVQRIKDWIAEGRKVKIFTARVSNKSQAQEVREALAPWLLKQGLPILEVVCCKDYAMLELWDDRAVQVIPNTGVAVVPPPEYTDFEKQPWTVCMTGLDGRRNIDGAWKVTATKETAFKEAQKLAEAECDFDNPDDLEWFMVHLFKGHHEDQN